MPRSVDQQPGSINDLLESSRAASGSPSSPFKSWRESIRVPRWVVYCQAALLGLIATTFFIFGMMVGSLTSGDAANDTIFDSRVAGSVAFRDEGDLKADEGAVVFLLPQGKKPDERSPGALVSPANFKALDNAAIDRIHELGGAVVRADENGQFDVLVDATYGNGLKYHVLIVSKSVARKDTDSMSKEQIAAIATFFMPVEQVTDDRSYHWMEITANGERVDLPEIEF
ncbi:MAG: hypothetical protein P8J27_12195 [Mariniblastus sp.]|nr:hypothetical protein [Mariniblastus sp.]